jgi:Flp pilus assembly protein TadG
MSPRQGRGKRRGGTLVESTFTTLAFMALLLGTVDMGVGIMRMHIVSEAARQGARKAIVQGDKNYTPSKFNGGAWGPSAFTDNGNSSSPIVTTIKPYLTGLDPSQVTINVTWPDGNNNLESRVTYQVSTTWSPMITWVFGSPTYTLTGTSTMQIAH